MQINFELSAHDFGFKWLRFPTKEYVMYFVILLSLYILVAQTCKLYMYLNVLNVLHVSPVTTKVALLSITTSLIMYVHILLIGVDLYSVKVLMEEKTVYSVDFSLIFFCTCHTNNIYKFDVLYFISLLFNFFNLV